MGYYGLIEKIEFQELIKEARKSCMKDALEKLRNFDAMNETFYREMMPKSAPKLLIKKHTNKLRLMKEVKELKRLLG